MIKYSSKAAQALAYLKRPINDIDIFVEDTGNHNMWLNLIRKFLPNGVKLSSVNLLGGRNNVVDACKLDQIDNGRKKLYIIDGDFDFLHGVKKKKLRHLYRLKAYCIENLLVNEHAMLRISVGLQPTLNENQIINIFNYEKWYADLVKHLVPLFTAYAVARKLTPSVQTVQFSVAGLYTQTTSGPDLDGRKVRARIRALYRLMLAHTDRNSIFSERQTIQNRINILNSDQVISGKDYILPVFWIRLKALMSYKGTFEQLKAQLADGCHAGVEPLLARRIRSAMA